MNQDQIDQQTSPMQSEPELQGQMQGIQSEQKDINYNFERQETTRAAMLQHMIRIHDQNEMI